MTRDFRFPEVRARQDALMAHMQPGQHYTARELSEALGQPLNATSMCLSALAKRGYVKRSAPRRRQKKDGKDVSLPATWARTNMEPEGPTKQMTPEQAIKTQKINNYPAGIDEAKRGRVR